jgi:hypothetical protein
VSLSRVAQVDCTARYRSYAVQNGFIPDNDQRVSPLDFDRAVFKGATGTHVYDVHMALGDIIDLVGTMLEAH